MYVGQPSDVDLLYLLSQARERNELEGISGIVLYDRRTFFQWIEGPNLALHAVWDNIRKDRRHTSVEVLADQVIPFALFSEWSMQFARRDDQFMRFMDGFGAAAPLLDVLHARQGLPRKSSQLSDDSTTRRFAIRSGPMHCQRRAALNNEQRTTCSSSEKLSGGQDHVADDS